MLRPGSPTLRPIFSCTACRWQFFSDLPASLIFRPTNSITPLKLSSSSFAYFLLKSLTRFPSIWTITTMTTAAATIALCFAHTRKPSDRSHHPWDRSSLWRHSKTTCRVFWKKCISSTRNKSMNLAFGSSGLSIRRLHRKGHRLG